MFIRATNGIPETYTIGQLRRDNPNVSFPKDIPEETLSDFNVYAVKPTPAPSLDSKTHRHTQDVVLVDTVWTQVWTVVELPLTQAEANTRAHRNHLLQETDWVISKATEQNAQDGLGVQIPTVWLDYRQALRDITLQEGFPYAIVWPNRPE